MLWNIHHPDSTRSGPVATEGLIDALRRGDLSGYAWVRREGETEWRPVASYEAFADLCDPEAPKDLPPWQTRLRFAAACGSVLFAFLVGMMAF